jgi:hypothetical protein
MTLTIRCRLRPAFLTRGRAATMSRQSSVSGAAVISGQHALPVATRRYRPHLTPLAVADAFGAHQGRCCALRRDASGGRFFRPRLPPAKPNFLAPFAGSVLRGDADLDTFARWTDRRTPRIC